MVQRRNLSYDRNFIIILYVLLMNDLKLVFVTKYASAVLFFAEFVPLFPIHKLPGLFCSAACGGGITSSISEGK
jgi:hypothetical protein